MLDNYRIIQKYKGPAVQGNWEYWLTHPERDHNTYQVKYAEQLKQRRQLFRNKDNNAMLEYMTQHTDLIKEHDNPLFIMLTVLNQVIKVFAF